MRGLPVWMLTLLVVLAGLLVIIGWEDRHEAGYLPFLLGLVWAVFTLAAIGAKVRFEDEV